MPITYPDSLPIAARVAEIEQAVRAHQVVVVCGETGSGKTTQLPKILLGLLPPGSRALIGHTQPRRIAASSVARRIAQELNTPLGGVVGYKVRFSDKLSRTTRIKLMTDGILLAETQTDPNLQQYAAIVIDEAHERSLNIDFLLGYLKQLLPRRPDLKVIITSATIDAQRLAQHFASHTAPAPVLSVSGRTYAVQIRYRPWATGAQSPDINAAIAQAVEELWREPQRGDILVFLPGERDIREAADHLRAHLSAHPLYRATEVLPLFSRLNAAQQERVFAPHSHLRIVLATNVAETSLTVEGIRYVIDTGTARIRRYSYRNKVDQLPIEPISQAAANQRAGRCGRVSEGICIRLYEEADFAARPPFPEPEILRSSLAGVILRMQSLHLGAVESFPFIDPPARRAIADGYQLLQELAAVDENNTITDLGHQLARLPLDPRIGRMVFEGAARGVLPEVLVVASALCVPDVRERPMEQQAQADQAHSQFATQKSEFLGILKLWEWLHSRTHPLTPSARGQAGQAAAQETRRQFESRLRAHFINPRRVREWRDTHAQLELALRETLSQTRLKPAAFCGLPSAAERVQSGADTRVPLAPLQTHLADVAPARPEGATFDAAFHQSILCGLLGNIGCKSDEEEWYLGARGIKFFRHPGVQMKKRPGRWIMCSEIVQTTRLFGRGIATIEPTWIESVANHLLKRQLLDPHWEKKSAQVVALERATLYGLVIYSGRRVDYARVAPQHAREIFIREALVAGQWTTQLPFLAYNQKLIETIETIEHQSRRQDVLVDDELIYTFYAQHIAPQVCNAHQLERWYRHASRSNPRLLQLSREELMRHEAAGITSEAYPLLLRLGGVDCKVTYLHDPQDSKDGLTVDVPLFALNQINAQRLEWLVPGMLKDKISALLRSLPQRTRARLAPLGQSAQQFTQELLAPHRFAHASLTEALMQLVHEKTALQIKPSDWKPETLQPHHWCNIRVLDAQGRQLGMGRNLGALQAALGGQARGAFAALAQPGPHTQPLPPSPGQTEPAAQTTAWRQRESNPALLPPTFPGTGTSGQNPTPSASPPPGLPHTSTRYTSWDFGALPEMLEVQSGAQTLIAFPALTDCGDAVTIEVLDLPDVAAAQHRAGLRRLVSLQIKDALKYLEKNLPELQKMSLAYMAHGTTQTLTAELLEVAMDKAFLMDPLPADKAGFEQRVREGRSRLNLLAGEVARLVSTILAEYARVQRKIKETKQATAAIADIEQQLQRLIGKRFVVQTPYPALQHLPRYLQAITMRLEKWSRDPARDAQRLKEIKPLEERYLRRLAASRAAVDARLEEYRWLLEELRVSFFAQELRTPQPVSVKRLDKVWASLQL